MTAITANTSAKTASGHFNVAFAAMIGFCADFCAGARQGREIETRYEELDRKSTPDLAKLGLTRSEIARAALHGHKH